MTIRATESAPIHLGTYIDINSVPPAISRQYESSADELARDFIWPDNRGPRPDSFLPHVLRKVLEERLRIAIFALNGIAVFCTGLLIQVSLVEYAHQAYISSYVVQTVASVQGNFLLSRYVTWG